MSRGNKVLGSITSTSIPSFDNISAAFNALWTMRPVATTVTSLPSLLISATPRGMGSLVSGTSPFILYKTLCSTKTTGLSSRIADIIRPKASLGVEG